MKTSLEVRFTRDNRVQVFKYRIHCVCCGAELDKVQTAQCAVDCEPPHCVPCTAEVLAEVEKDLSMWPVDWYGNAWTGVDDDWYVVVRSSGEEVD